MVPSDAGLESVVLGDVSDGTAQLTPDRSDRSNAFTPKMGAEWVRLLRELGEDDSLRVITVTGAGRAFCAGGALAFFEERPARWTLTAGDAPSVD